MNCSVLGDLGKSEMHPKWSGRDVSFSSICSHSVFDVFLMFFFDFGSHLGSTLAYVSISFALLFRASISHRVFIDFGWILHQGFIIFDVNFAPSPNLANLDCLRMFHVLRRCSRF